MKRTMILTSLAALGVWTALAQKADTGATAGEAIHTKIFDEHMAHHGLMGPLVKGAPYSAEITTETNQTLSDGTHIHRQEAYKMYRDSEGRVRRESGDEVWISDPVANASYVLDTARQTAHKMPLAHPGEKIVTGAGGGNVAYTRRMVVASTDGPPPMPPMLHPGPGQFFFMSTNDAKHDSLGKQTIMGVETEGTRMTVVIPEGQIGNDRPMQMVHEVWRSPELQVVMLSKHTDPQMGETTERVTSLQRGEPDPTLFTVPPGYQMSK